MPGEQQVTTKDQSHTRLLKALRESEILRELTELLASSLDTTHILQVLVKRTTEVCDVERCAVWLLDEKQGQFLPSAYHLAPTNLKQQDREAADQNWYRSSLSVQNVLIQRLLQSAGILAIEDLRHEPSVRIIATKFLVRSILLVALLREGRLVGMMSLDKPNQKCIFTQEQRQLARAIGQQAAVAIDNARLYQQAQEERQRAERLIGRAQSLYQVAMAVNSDKDVTTVLDIAAQHLTRALNAESAMMALIRGDSLVFLRKKTNYASNGTSGGTLPTPNLYDLPHCITAARQEKPIFVTIEDTNALEKSWYMQIGFDNVFIVPLITGPQQVQLSDISDRLITPTAHIVGFAFITFNHSEKPPSPGQYAFAQDIAAQCALAINKANLLTEARKAAMLATERVNTLDAVFNAMSEGIIVLDLEGKVIITNSTAVHLMGLSTASFPQLQTYLQSHPIYTLHGHPISVEDFPLSRALRGEYVRGERFTSQRADGSERVIEVNIAPLFNGEGSKIGIVGAFRDITEHIRVEQRIRRALDIMLHAVEAVSGTTDLQVMLQRVLEMTMEAIPSDHAAIQLYDQERRVFDPLLSLGFTPDEEITWLAEQKRWLEPTEHQYQGFREQLSEGHATLISAEQGPDGSDISYHTMILAAPMMHNNHLLGLLMLDRSSLVRRETIRQFQSGHTHPLLRNEFTIWDIAVTEGIARFAGLAMEQAHWQQEAEIARTNEATMRESNQLKDEFLAITAHEFRTPLTIILAYNQKMARFLRKKEDLLQELRDKFKESIENIDTQTHHLTNIVNTFLEVTRLNRGQISLTFENLSLEKVVTEAVNTQSQTSTEHTIRAVIEPGECPYIIKGDRARLLQIFANLLQNAIKYSPLGGPITVTLHQYRDAENRWQAEICVADKGIGIPIEAQARLFECFYRAPNSEGNKTRGVGLGLYVVAEFVRLHSGTIRVESSGMMGEGSRFILTLPLIESIA